ncbi:MAG TPA: hypothetical protein PLR18_02520 [bacterium]|nr:hypothetical protein [bacterium]
MSKCRLVKKNKLFGGSQSAKGKRNCPGKGISVFCLLLFALIAVSGVYCLGILNSRAGHSFELADREKELQKLKEDNKNLTVLASELQQVARIQEAAANLGLVTTEKVDYLSAKVTGLVKK